MARAKKSVKARDRVLLLRRKPYGNTSLVVHGITESSGRVELVCKGAHRPKSRFSGVLDWFDTLHLEWSPPRSSGPSTGSELTLGATRLSPLSWGDLDVRRRWLSRSLFAYRAAHTALELTDLVTRSGYADATLFHLLERALDSLDELARQDAEGLVRDGDVRIQRRLARFELQLLGELGLAPSLVVCAACGGPAPAVSGEGAERRAPFAALGGGRLCGQHATEAHAAGLKVGTLPTLVLEAAAALAEDTRATERMETALHRAPLPGEDLDGADDARRKRKKTPELILVEQVLDFAGRFLDHQLETRPKSHAAFLAAPDRNRRKARISGR